MKSSYNIRQRLFSVIEIAKSEDRASSLYDGCMVAVILISIVPLFFKFNHPVFRVIEWVSFAIFAVDYLLRWITADLKIPRFRNAAFLLYPVTPLALIDLFSLLPMLLPINAGFRLFRLVRLFRAFKALRLLRYSKSFSIILAVMQRERRALLAVCAVAFGYMILSALILFSVEPDIFDTFFDAFYWAAVTLTTVGYGDIYPTTDIGRLMGMISSFMGIAIVALPTGIITAGYMDTLRNSKK